VSSPASVAWANSRRSATWAKVKVGQIVDQVLRHEYNDVNMSTASMVGRLSCCSTPEMVSMASTVPPLSNEAEDVVVSKELRRDQNQGHNCESDLDLFSPKAPV
jgi:hypothetical protein